ncbi:phage uncharacterized protein [Clostridiales bacterium oral taxon 876 str. F0540]|nr:phage uncharacterized protein [Clostridiales bacterium oral taxon 876 str. F0540]
MHGASEEQADQATQELMLKNKDNLFNYHGLAYALGSRNLEFFSLYFLQNIFIGEDKADIAEIHRDIWEEIQGMILEDTHDKQEYVLPRGTGKSTFVSLVTAIWCSVYKYKRYTVIASAIGDTASTFIRNIKLALENNDRIEKAFGKLYDTKKCIVNSEQIELTNRTMIQSISASSTLRGKSYGNTRIELLLLDDYQKDDEVATADQREKKWKRFSDDVKFAVQKGNSTIIAVGTLQNNECFYSRLKNLPTWKHRLEKGVLVDNVDELFSSGLWLEFKNILFNSKDEFRLDNAKEFYLQHEKEMQYPLLWQEYWNCLDMALSYYENPASFKQEVQGDTAAIGEKRFKTIVTESAETIETHDFKVTMLTIDPASSTGKSNDYSAFIVGSKSDNNIKYCRKGEILKLNFDDYINHAIDLLKKYSDITHIYIEKNLYMGADVIKLKELIANDDELRNRNFTFINEMQKKNKFDKIDSIVGDINFGRVIFNEEDIEALEQLKDYQGEKSLHDDFPDCLAECVIRLDTLETISTITLLDRKLFF